MAKERIWKRQPDGSWAKVTSADQASEKPEPRIVNERPPPPEDPEIRRLRLYAREQLEKGKSPKQVVSTLRASGVEAGEAWDMVGRTKFVDDSELMRQAFALAGQTALFNTVVGAIVFSAGLAVTLGSHNVPGDRYILWWGALLFGGVQLLAGLGGFLSAAVTRRH